MPATEKTWRDQARMHVIFGITTLLMLVGTIWMLAKDHNREWRDYQLDDRAKERWTTEAQLAQAEAEASGALTRLNSQLAAARMAPIEGSIIQAFKDRVEAEDERLANRKIKEEDPADFSALNSAQEKFEAASDDAEKTKTRQKLIDELNRFAREAKRRENKWLTEKKLRAADQTAFLSARGIAVGEGKPTADLEAKIQTTADEIVAIDARLADAKDYRLDLEGIVKNIQAKEIEKQTEIASVQADLNRFREALPGVLKSTGEWINRAPVVDALYTGDIRLDQIWLPDMKINYNFSSVARYDRCIVCHRAIDKTAKGSAIEPAYPAIPRNERVGTVTLTTPTEAPATTGDDGKELPAPSLYSVYGLTVTAGQINEDDVTVQVVVPQSLAAQAGLQSGDVILAINDGKVESEANVRHYLLTIVNWGEPQRITIRRGLDQPFTSHPRLDLFVGSTSPHKKGEMGCTICHDGQGSATDFKWASHTPNDPRQANKWAQTHGWFDNHHWIFPMMPQRFLESNCLKCHHEVVELEPSERFPEPPAPKLVHGYNLVRQYGCYGCHEVPGYDGPKRTGPDLRSEPNYAEVALQILADGGLNEFERELASTLAQQPSNDEIRGELLRAITADAGLGNQKAETDTANLEAAEEGGDPRLTPATHALADALNVVDAPGRLRKVGPSLRHLASKVDYDWLYNWIRRPGDFRPTTRMPQFFGLHDHLDGKNKNFVIHSADGKEQKISDREYTHRFENIEIRALSEFLLNNSQPFEYLEQPANITEAPSPERGRWQFESRGCLACHSHKDFPGINSTQGPDLSRVAAKFNSVKGQRWLYSWVKEPNRYHSRTVMPNVFLDPIEEKDATGNPTGKVVDPAADVMAFLLSVPADWQPEAVAPERQLSPEEQAALNDLTTVWLSASFPRLRAERFAKEGIDDRLGPSLKVDEKVLLGKFSDDQDRTQRQLEYVARRSLSRYGCFGCHDIPGYETAKPIGTPLASWGRKDPTQLAFENIGQFLATHGIEPTVDASLRDANSSVGDTRLHDEHDSHAHGLDPLSDEFTSDEAYFLQSLNSHQRHGFLWQKLRQPRSFDYEATRTKRYDERLRMPKFPFNDDDREAVMTFILGLTNEAPAERYIYKPSLRQKAIVEGRHVLEKYNCAGCHVIDMERWDVAFAPDWFEAPTPTNEFPFVRPVVTPAEIDASLKPDRRGMLHAQLHGMAVRDEATGAPRLVDEDEVPLEPDDKESQPYYQFQLFDHAVVAGAPRLVGTTDATMLIEAQRNGHGPTNGTAFPTNGGDLAKYLFPRVIAEEHKTNPSAIATEAWGWLPPPLHHEGSKVQTDWLHDFLMDPTQIRPAVVLRMPNFRMSSAEAAALVDYFAAKSNSEFPYEYNQRRRGGYLAQLEKSHPTLLDDAMKIVTDGNYCVKCHSVGDYEVRGSVRTLGPDLDEIYRRLRPEYTRQWIANPQRILPYTGMPMNIPFDPAAANLGGVNQALFPGSSIRQVDGVVDLLMNFDEYTKRRTSVKELVREPTTPPAGEQQPRASSDPPNDRSAQRKQPPGRQTN